MCVSVIDVHRLQLYSTLSWIEDYAVCRCVVHNLEHKQHQQQQLYCRQRRSIIL